MITDIRNIEIYTADQMSNEDYHKHANVSGSTLCKIFNTCPAEYKYAEPTESKALTFGISGHAAMLEPDLFDREFVKALDKEEYPDALTSDASMKAWLKERGCSGYSTKKKDELTAQILAHSEISGEVVHIWHLMLEEFERENENKTIVPVNDFETIMKMRQVVHQDPQMNSLFKDATIEMSLFCDVLIGEKWHSIKVKPDVVTANNEIPDYKTTANSDPEKFGRDAYYMGYWLKQAFISDVFSLAYDRTFRPGLLAQCKKSPFIHQMYWLTQDQIRVGREQYTFALQRYTWCKENNTWPSYFDGAVDLPTPDYVARLHDFEQDEISIKFEE